MIINKMSISLSIYLGRTGTLSRVDQGPIKRERLSVSNIILSALSAI